MDKKVASTSSRIKRAKIFLTENIINRNSWSRALCFISLDLALVLTMVYNFKQMVDDWAYWSRAPNAFNIFIFLHY